MILPLLTRHLSTPLARLATASLLTLICVGFLASFDEELLIAIVRPQVDDDDRIVAVDWIQVESHQLPTAKAPPIRVIEERGKCKRLPLPLRRRPLRQCPLPNSTWMEPIRNDSSEENRILNDSIRIEPIVALDNSTEQPTEPIRAAPIFVVVATKRRRWRVVERMRKLFLASPIVEPIPSGGELQVESASGDWEATIPQLFDSVNSEEALLEGSEQAFPDFDSGSINADASIDEERSSTTQSITHSSHSGQVELVSEERTTESLDIAVKSEPASTHLPNPENCTPSPFFHRPSRRFLASRRRFALRNRTRAPTLVVDTRPTTLQIVEQDDLTRIPPLIAPADDTTTTTTPSSSIKRVYMIKSPETDPELAKTFLDRIDSSSVAFEVVTAESTPDGLRLVAEHNRLLQRNRHRQLIASTARRCISSLLARLHMPASVIEAGAAVAEHVVLQPYAIDSLIIGVFLGAPLFALLGLQVAFRLVALAGDWLWPRRVELKSSIVEGESDTESESEAEVSNDDDDDDEMRRRLERIESDTMATRQRVDAYCNSVTQLRVELDSMNDSVTTPKKVPNGSVTMPLRERNYGNEEERFCHRESCRCGGVDAVDENRSLRIRRRSFAGAEAPSDYYTDDSSIC